MSGIAVGKLPSAGLTHSNDLAKASWPGTKERLPLTTVHFNERRSGNAKFCLQGSHQATCGSVECCANLTISGALIMVTEPPMRLPHVHACSHVSLCGSLGIIALVVGPADVKAQEAEPRSYSNTPIGLNFLIAGYVYAQGKLAFDPNLSIADANFHSNTGLLAYVRSFDFAGQSAKFDVIVPGSSFDAQGL